MTAKTEEDAVDYQHEQPKQPHLSVQDATKVDPNLLTALSPEVVRILVCWFRLGS